MRVLLVWVGGEVAFFSCRGLGVSRLYIVFRVIVSQVFIFRIVVVSFNLVFFCLWFRDNVGILVMVVFFLLGVDDMGQVGEFVSQFLKFAFLLLQGLWGYFKFFIQYLSGSFLCIIFFLFVGFVGGEFGRVDVFQY